ncbi:MAG: hypothetical protein NZ604_05950 [Flavobacteriales bacterium]|nr:hypothetical protein [Flavobacteriales bacterium]
MSENYTSQKKPTYPVGKPLMGYLRKYSRELRIPVRYLDLKHYFTTVPLEDNGGDPTLWETVLYSESDMKELNEGLTETYSILKSDGTTHIEHLSVDRIDYCSFGNSHPFRVKIINQLNDNYDYFYVKKVDASRIYGLELEHILSPNKINYLVYKDAIIEEHIAGIPGDQFVDVNLKHKGNNELRLAKEFVKFNERCFIRLLGDMRSYNFVIDITPDFDQVQYRIRAIDFDQQSFEGRKNMYLPQYYKENKTYVELAMKHMSPETIEQYKLEERALMAKRLRLAKSQVKELMEAMMHDELSLPKHIHQLKEDLYKHYDDATFLKCKKMGEIVRVCLDKVHYH